MFPFFKHKSRYVFFDHQSTVFFQRFSIIKSRSLSMGFDHQKTIFFNRILSSKSKAKKRKIRTSESKWHLLPWKFSTEIYLNVSSSTFYKLKVRKERLKKSNQKYQLFVSYIFCVCWSVPLICFYNTLTKWIKRLLNFEWDVMIKSSTKMINKKYLIKLN